MQGHLPIFQQLMPVIFQLHLCAASFFGHCVVDGWTWTAPTGVCWLFRAVWSVSSGWYKLYWVNNTIVERFKIAEARVFCFFLYFYSRTILQQCCFADGVSNRFIRNNQQRLVVQLLSITSHLLGNGKLGHAIVIETSKVWHNWIKAPSAHHIVLIQVGQRKCSWSCTYSLYLTTTCTLTFDLPVTKNKLRNVL